MAAEACLVATLSTPPVDGGGQLRALPDAVEWLEVRGDLVGRPDPDWLRSHFKGTSSSRFEARPKAVALKVPHVKDGTTSWLRRPTTISSTSRVTGTSFRTCLPASRHRSA